MWSPLTAACLPAGLTGIPTGEQGVCCAYLLKNAADPKSWQLVCNRDINRVSTLAQATQSDLWQMMTRQIQAKTWCQHCVVTEVACGSRGVCC